MASNPELEKLIDDVRSRIQEHHEEVLAAVRRIDEEMEALQQKKRELLRLIGTEPSNHAGAEQGAGERRRGSNRYLEQDISLALADNTDGLRASEIVDELMTRTDLKGDYAGRQRTSLYTAVFNALKKWFEQDEEKRWHPPGRKPRRKKK